MKQINTYIHESIFDIDDKSIVDKHSQFIFSDRTKLNEKYLKPYHLSLRDFDKFITMLLTYVKLPKKYNPYDFIWDVNVYMPEEHMPWIMGVYINKDKYNNDEASFECWPEDNKFVCEFNVYTMTDKRVYDCFNDALTKINKENDEKFNKFRC